MLIRALLNLAETRFKLENIRNKLAEKIRPNSFGINTAVAMCRCNIYRCKIKFSVRFFNKPAANFFNIAVCHADTVNRRKNGNSAPARIVNGDNTGFHVVDYALDLVGEPVFRHYVSADIVLVLPPVVRNKADTVIAKPPTGILRRSRKKSVVALIKIVAFVILLGNKVFAVGQN